METASVTPNVGATRHALTARPAAMTAAAISQLSALTPLYTASVGGP